MRSTLPWAVLLSLAPAAAQAQDVCAENLKWPAVGQWAEYKGTYGKNPMSTRYSVIGAEQRNGTEYKWIELKSHDEKRNKDMIYQMLVPGGPLQVDQVQEVVLKAGSDPAMKLDGMMLQMLRGQLAKNSAFADACTETVLVGVEKVTVPAGSFKAMHFQSSKYSTDSWIDPKVPFTMLKSVGKSHEVELVATGSGAKSSIAETPAEMGGIGQ